MHFLPPVSCRGFAQDRELGVPHKAVALPLHVLLALLAVGGIGPARQSATADASFKWVSVTAPASIQLGESLTVVAKVTNIGTTTSSGVWHPCWSLSAWGATWDAGWEGFEAESRRAVPAGGTDTLTVVVPAYLLPSYPGARFSFKISGTTYNSLGLPGLMGTSQFVVFAVTSAVNTPPVVDEPPATPTHAGQRISLQVNAYDSEPVTFALVPPTAEGAAIDAQSGLFDWQVPLATPPGDYTFNVKVTDTGAPPLSAATTITISVLPLPRLTGVALDEEGLATLTWEAEPGAEYHVEYTDDLASTVWTDMGVDIWANDVTASVSDPEPAARLRYYRIVLIQQ